MIFRSLSLVGLLLVAGSDCYAGMPTATDDRLVFELVAKEPQIVTPTGLAVDEKGRIWVIENHTHQRSADYRGPSSDRIRVFSDFDADGKSKHVTTFAEGFKNSMGLALSPEGNVYLATRSDIYLLTRRSGSETAEGRTVIVRLVSPGTYPHNGLSGFAFDALGNLYFGLGENTGAPYRLIGADGTTLSGGGEGGSIYRCRSDGTNLERIATGFWNPFHLTVDALGRLFAIDNDPDSRGPCRLLHIVQGGDYGFRYRNGRKGIHPFTAWNGELPGTLPMTAGTSEAPCGILAYESTGLPAEYRGDLLVTSWGDHVVERFHLADRGASFGARSQTLVRGGEDFRPVGIASAPDGSLYFSDWVDKSYPVHGKGRIWRLRMKRSPTDDGIRVSRVSTFSNEQLQRFLAHPKQEIRNAAGKAFAHREKAGAEILGQVLRSEADIRARLQSVWAIASVYPVPSELIRPALNDAEPSVRAEAARVLGRELQRDSDDEAHLLKLALKDPSAYVRHHALLQLKSPTALRETIPVLADPDPFLASAALEVLGRPASLDLLLSFRKSTDAKLRLAILTALRRSGGEKGKTALPDFLADLDPGVRRAAIQWVGEERLPEFEPFIDAAASRAPVTRELFEAFLATRALLAGEKRGPKEEVSGEDYVVKIVKDPARSSPLRAIALRMVRPNHPALAARDLRQLLASAAGDLRREAIVALAQRSDKEAQEILRGLLRDGNTDSALLPTAITGLARSVENSGTSRQLLLPLLANPSLSTAVLRSLRGLTNQPEVSQAILDWWDQAKETLNKSPEERRDLAEQVVFTLRSSQQADIQQRLKALGAIAGKRPEGEAGWRALLSGRGDAAAGEQVFFHLRGAGCFACHRINGRGGMIGPDLSRIGSALSREKLLESILSPSKEIAPQYTTWQILTRDGKIRTGMIVEEGPNSTITLADSQGKLETIHRTTVEERRALPISIMPERLYDLMTRRELLDLVTFLGEQK